MPRVDTSIMDPRMHVALADGKPLMRAIPKHNLRMLAADYGSQAALAQELSSSRRTVHRQDLNAWINGTKHMSNQAVIRVSHVLGVSPLCVLDLCAPNESEAPGAMAVRDSMTMRLQAICMWQTNGEKAPFLKYYRRPEEALSYMLEDNMGDYRDLKRLAVDVAAYYAATCDPAKLGSLIAHITAAGSAYWL